MTTTTRPRCDTAVHAQPVADGDAAALASHFSSAANAEKLISNRREVAHALLELLAACLSSQMALGLWRYAANSDFVFAARVHRLSAATCQALDDITVEVVCALARADGLPLAARRLVYFFLCVKVDLASPPPASTLARRLRRPGPRRWKM